jgi:hypothetical protein
VCVSIHVGRGGGDVDSIGAGILRLLVRVDTCWLLPVSVHPCAKVYLHVAFDGIDGVGNHGRKGACSHNNGSHGHGSHSSQRAQGMARRRLTTVRAHSVMDYNVYNAGQRAPRCVIGRVGFRVSSLALAFGV